MATARLPVMLLNGPVYVGAAGDERIVGYVNDLDDPSRRHPVELHALAGGQTVHGYPVVALVPLSRPDAMVIEQPVTVVGSRPADAV